VAQVIESLTADGRDRSLDYKISGFHVPKGSWDAQVLDAIAPTADEIVLPKTSSSAFISTNLDTVLRNLGVKVSAPQPSPSPSLPPAHRPGDRPDTCASVMGCGRDWCVCGVRTMRVRVE
jgi:hypothetical protein